MRCFVGLGEGIGNVVLGLPLLDALHEAGHEVFVDLRATPPEITRDLMLLIRPGRAGLRVAEEYPPDHRFGAAFLTHWWLSRGAPLPRARRTYVGGGPAADVPEILANLDAAARVIPPHLRGPTWGRARLFAQPCLVETDAVRVGVHPGCKADPEWKRRKVYPRWAEVVHRLKDLGAQPWILGTPADDAYCGEPHEDLRNDALSLQVTARHLASMDVVLSGDSGLHHVAVALGVPTVALFGLSSVEKARHPNPAVPPVIFGPCDSPEEFAALDPRMIARAAVDAAARRKVA